MPTIEERIEIAAPRETVFAFTHDPANALLWQTNMTEYERATPDIVGKGERTKGVARVAGRRIEWLAEYTEYQEPEHAHLRSLESPMSFDIDWRFRDLGGGRTEFVYHQEVPEIGGFFGKLGDALVTRMYSRDVRSNLEKLKVLLEAE